VTGLIERESQLEALSQSAAGSVRSGSMVFVSGEAGHGKTSLIDCFLASLDHRFRVIQAACEPLGRPLAFGPLLAVIDDLPDAVQEQLLRGADRPAVYREMLRAVRTEPTVVVVEDVHWADEATLGLVRHVGRTIAETSSVLIVSVRPEEIDPAHPLRVLTADIGRQALRIELPPLTPQGVEEATSGTELDPAAVYATTLGNPFFVEELVRNPGPEIPATVVEAIESAVAGLADGVREVLELVSLTADGLEIGMLDSFESSVDAACQRRLLTVSGGRVRCRHDLIRAALDQGIPPVRRRRLHCRLVRMLEQSGGDQAQRIARLAYHSHHAGLGEETVRYAVEAASRAAAVGSHREAARSYGWAFEHRGSMPAGELKAMLRAAAYEHLLINELVTAIEIAQEMRLSARDERERAESDAWIAFLALRYGDTELAEHHIRSAFTAIDDVSPSPALARAQAAEAVVALGRGASNGIELAERAVEAARQARAAAIEADCLITLGTALAAEGSARGYEIIERGGLLARDVRSLDAAARAVYQLGALPFREMRLEDAKTAMDEGLEYLAAEQLDAWYVAVEATRAHISVIECDWDGAADAPRPGVASSNLSLHRGRGLPDCRSPSDAHRGPVGVACARCGAGEGRLRGWTCRAGHGGRTGNGGGVARPVGSGSRYRPVHANDWSCGRSRRSLVGYQVDVLGSSSGSRTAFGSAAWSRCRRDRWRPDQGGAPLAGVGVSRRSCDHRGIRTGGSAARHLLQVGGARSFRNSRRTETAAALHRETWDSARTAASDRCSSGRSHGPSTGGSRPRRRRVQQ
jgi:hypothetical protein